MATSAETSPLIRHVANPFERWRTENYPRSAGGGCHHGPMGCPEAQIRLTFESMNTLWDAMASMALARFVTGEEPYARELAAARVMPATDLVPVDSVVRRVSHGEVDRVLARGPGRPMSSASETGRRR